MLLSGPVLSSFKGTSSNRGRDPSVLHLEPGEVWRGEGLLQRSPEAIGHLKKSILEGKPWHIALLEAIGLWSESEEVCRGRHYRYLIAGEAFDWLLLAERLCKETDDLIPFGERHQLLSSGQFPGEVSEEEFKSLVGMEKYRGILNYWYGVTVEKALQLSVGEEVSKEMLSKGFSGKTGVVEQAFQRIYGEPRNALLDAFRKERGDLKTRATASHEVKEFTYWLFKLRLLRCEKARIASDTRKGLGFLERTGTLPFAPSMRSP